MEYKSFDRGTLLKILVPAGSVVQLGQPVAIIGAPGEDVSALAGGSGGAAAAKPSAAEAQPKGERAAPPAGGDAPVTSPPPAARGEAVSPPTQPAAPQPSSNGRVKASPYVRKLGRERGLDLSSVAGSGPRGRIVRNKKDKRR